MSKAIVQTYKIFSDYRHKIVMILIVASCCMVLIYGMTVYSLIIHTVTLQKVDTELASIQKSVNKLDMDYLKLSSSITIDKAKGLGMNEGQVSEYIYRPGSLGRAIPSGHGL
jgi:hypothetical protein